MTRRRYRIRRAGKREPVELPTDPDRRREAEVEQWIAVRRLAQQTLALGGAP